MKYLILACLFLVGCTKDKEILDGLISYHQEAKTSNKEVCYKFSKTGEVNIDGFYCLTYKGNQYVSHPYKGK